MKVNLAEFLKDFCTEIPESISSGEVYRLTYTEDLKHFSIYADFTKLLEYEDILLFERAVREAVRTDSVRLMPHYPAELFCLGYFSTLIGQMKREVSVVNGFLENAETELSGNVLKIKLFHGGSDILDKYDFCGSHGQNR